MEEIFRKKSLSRKGGDEDDSVSLLSKFYDVPDSVRSATDNRPDQNGPKIANITLTLEKESPLFIGVASF